LAFQTERLAKTAGESRGVDDPIGFERIGAVGRLDRQSDVILMRCDAGDAIAPAQLGGGKLAQAIDEIGLDVELLEIDEGRLLRQRARREVEGVEDILVGEHAADRPGDAALGDALVDAEAIEDLEALLRIADAAARGAAHADRVVLVEQYDRYAAAREIAGCGQAAEPAAHHGDAMAVLLAVELGRTAIGIDRQGIAAPRGFRRRIHRSLPWDRRDIARPSKASGRSNASREGRCGGGRAAR